MKKVSMNYNDYVKEHKHLIKILKKGSKSERLTEASKQMREMMSKLK
jgi:hypothetical protein